MSESALTEHNINDIKNEIVQLNQRLDKIIDLLTNTFEDVNHIKWIMKK